MPNQEKIAGIGLRIWRGNPWGFESPLSHQGFSKRGYNENRACVTVVSLNDRIRAGKRRREPNRKRSRRPVPRLASRCRFAFAFPLQFGSVVGAALFAPPCPFGGGISSSDLPLSSILFSIFRAASSKSPLLTMLYRSNTVRVL
jgi:hypothetical protein